LISLTAFRLQRSAAMRASGLAVLIAATLLGGRAGAQTPPASLGSCTGMVAATIGVAAPRHPGEPAESIFSMYQQYSFGKAECDCDTTDVVMRIQLSMCLPTGSQGNPTLWVGSSACSNYTTRTTTNQTQCQQFTATNVSAQSFNAAGGNCSTTTFFDVEIPARALFSPTVGNCDVLQASNQVFIFIGPDQTMPIATCTLPLTEQGSGPTAAINTSAASGDGAVTVNWSAPPVGSVSQPYAFQVLCADDAGNPIKSPPDDAAYSSCQADGIHRNQTLFGASSVSTGSASDGGVATDGGLSSASFGLRGAGAASPAVTDDMGTDDMGTDDMGTDDMAPGTTLNSGIRPTVTGLPAPFTNLDPRFACTGQILSNAQDYSSRIKGLTNNAKYHFVVLAIDLFGNATPTDVFDGTPRPVDNLYARYREAGGTAQGFCFVATAAFGDYDHPQVRVLRAFRDLVLDRSAAGRAFIRGYYAVSPPLARFIAGGSARRAIARALLWPLVGVALLALRTGSLLIALLITVGAPGLLVWALRRRRRRRRALGEVPSFATSGREPGVSV
jgi:hypothetical protein